MTRPDQAKGGDHDADDNRHTLELAQILAPFLVNGELELSPEKRRRMAADIFHRGAAPAGVLRPATAESLVRAASLAAKAGFAIVPRGGGLSYSGGLVSDRSRTLVVETDALSAIAIDAQAMHVTVGAGCTWARLYEQLRALGLRTRFWGPASGGRSTIGGALSQQAVLFGSGRHGPAGDNVLAMTIATADGRLRTTPGPDTPSPSDFIGDCGALGIKVEAVLPLEPTPAHIRFAASRFAARADALAALAQISAARVTTDCFLFDRWNSDQRRQPTADEPWEEPIPGQRLRRGSAFEIHAAFEGDTVDKAEADRDAFMALCNVQGGQALGDGVMPALRNSPFGPPALLVGPDGRRWVPVHFIVPVQRLDAMVAAVEACMVQHEALIRRHDIVWGWSILLIGDGDALLEPALYWRDAHPDQVTTALPAGYLDNRPRHPEDPEARAAVGALRAAMVDAGRLLDARHMQLGRLYPADTAYSAWTEGELRVNKRLLDPDSRMNPGVLGLG